ncbi:MAG: pyridoxamine 5'-phosphate oxidase [Cellvibrionaceae bacterium]|nr:pyridoxamine 5'-phosphate oxidase [Cellvibrionaceae bacterium]
MDLHHFRRHYLKGGLRRADLHADPIVQFQRWLDEMIQLESASDPTAMVLATVDQRQRLSQRTVLLKQINTQGFVFFTNKTSHKAEAIAANAGVSLHFPWHMAERQVMVEGLAQGLTDAEDDHYFAGRPRESQLGAWASAQSQPIASRQVLLAAYAAKEAEYPQRVPRPAHWGGYRIIPQRIEFWQGGGQRLHDRFVYQRESAESWSITRLAP